MQTLMQDLRYGARMLVKQPGFTLIAILTLALGIGANTAIFSLVDKLLLRSLPVSDPHQLVLLTAESVNPKFLNNIFSYPDYVDYRDQNQVLSGLLAFNQGNFKMGTGEQREKISLELVSGNYFAVLGVKASLGRTVQPDDNRTEGAHPVVVLSHGFWQRRFNSDPTMIGRQITLEGANFTVIGVAAPSYRGMSLEYPADAWVPLMMRAPLLKTTVATQERKLAWLKLIGRLKPGVAHEQAQASLDLTARNVREAVTPSADRNLPFYEKRLLLSPAAQGISYLRPKLNQTLRLLMTVVGLLLLIACANIATLLLARATTRRKEIAVRLALGASRWRLLRQLLTESLVLALIGAGIGLLFAPWLFALLLAYQPNLNLAPTILSDSLDARVLGFALLLTVLSSLVFGLVPALQSSRTDLVPALKDSELMPHRERWWNARNLLVVVQVALALIVLIGAGLLVKSLRNLFAIDPGFKPENVLLVSIALPREQYANKKTEEQFQQITAQQNQFYQQLAERVQALPGVVAATTASITPMSGSVGTMSVTIEGYQGQPVQNIGIDYNTVGPGYHELMGIPIAQGRGLTPTDRTGTPNVVVINEAMARLYFPNQNPLGKRLNVGTIIGVTRDLKIHKLTEAPLPHFDIAALQHPYGNYVRLLVRTAGEPTALVAAVRQEVKTLNPEAAIDRVTTVSAELENSIAAERMAAALTSVFGLIALVLAVIGLYGVMTFAVSRRTREVGIRMALGAQSRDVLKLVIGQGLRLTLAGVCIGLGGALALTRLIESLLFSVSATDPLTFVVIPILLTGVALLACWIPAQRATQVDPMIALRCE
jgi:predicted permease